MRLTLKQRNLIVCFKLTMRFWCSFGRENYYQEGNVVYPRLKVLEAYKRALTTWSKWVDKNINRDQTHVVFRGYSVTHFRYIANWKEKEKICCWITAERDLDRMEPGVSFAEEGHGTREDNAITKQNRSSTQVTWKSILRRWELSRRFSMTQWKLRWYIWT